MNTMLLASTSNITGNIGSCTSQTISTVSGRDSFFTQNILNTVTNSCTGEVMTYHTWEVSVDAVILGVFILFSLFLIALFRS